MLSVYMCWAKSNQKKCMFLDERINEKKKAV